MVETMRYADPGDCEEMAQAQEAFFTELSKYLSLSRSLSENQEWFKPQKIKDSVFWLRKKKIALYKINAKEVFLNGHSLGVYLLSPRQNVELLCKSQ